MASHRSMSQDRSSEKASSPGSGTTMTASNYWSSLKSKLVPSTMHTMTYRADHDTRLSRHHSNLSDSEIGTQLDMVIFNNRLDVPSIGSRTDDSPSQSSRCGDHRELEDRDFEAQLDEGDARKQESYGSWRRKESVMAIDCG